MKCPLCRNSNFWVRGISSVKNIVTTAMEKMENHKVSIFCKSKIDTTSSFVNFLWLQRNISLPYDIIFFKFRLRQGSFYTTRVSKNICSCCIKASNVKLRFFIGDFSQSRTNMICYHLLGWVEVNRFRRVIQSITILAWTGMVKVSCSYIHFWL